MSKRHPALIGLLLGALAMGACNQKLEPIEANQCGNKIFEPHAGEDCDGEANCRPPGGHGECRFACNPEAECPDGCDSEPGCAGPAPCCPAGLECCPSGFACGVDSVCRRSTGEFVVVDESSTPTLGLSLGDLDGDGRVDVVRLSPDMTSVHFYDDGLTPALVQTIMGGPSLPVVGDLTSDGRADLALRVFMGTDPAGGVAVLRAQPDRTLASTIYSGITLLGIENARFGVVDALPPALPRELVQFGDRIARCVQPGKGMGELANGLTDASELVGIAVGNFDEDPDSSPCGEVAFAFGGAEQIELLESCEPHETKAGEFQFATQQELDPVLLPNDFKVFDLPDSATPSVDPRQMQRVFAVHWNGGDEPPNDWHLDLLILARESSASAGAWRLLIAYGMGDGSFNSSLPLPEPPLDADGTAALLELKYVLDDLANPLVFQGGTNKLGVPLVFDDFNGDQVLDVVGSMLLLMSDSGGGDEYEYRCAMSDTRWAAAVVRDFNGNGTVDLVAARQKQSGLDFLDGTGDGAFSLSALPSERPVSHLAAGDFDGDLLADVVFVQPAATQTDDDGEGDEDDALYVSFGRPAGSPELPVKLGELASIEQIMPGPIRAADSAEEIIILARTAPGTDHPLGAGIVIGNGDRQLHAPFIFQPMIDGPKTTMPLWIAHGRFSSDETVQGFGLMTQDPPRLVDDEDPDSEEIEGSNRVWLVRSTGEQAELSASYTGDSGDEPSGLVCDGCVVAAVDLGEDQIDELITFGPDLTEGGIGLLTVYEVVEGQGFERTTEEAGYPTSFAFADVRNPPWTVVRPIVRDIDRDGRRDLAVTAGSVVALFWNDGTAEIAQQWASEQASVTRIEIPSGEELTDIALLNADEDRELELVVLTTSGVRLLQLIGSRQWQSFEDGEPLLDSATKDLLAGGDVIAAGDLDGDGVEDLVIGDSGSYRALRGQTVRP